MGHNKQHCTGQYGKQHIRMTLVDMEHNTTVLHLFAWDTTALVGM